MYGTFFNKSIANTLFIGKTISEWGEKVDRILIPVMCKATWFIFIIPLIIR